MREGRWGDPHTTINQKPAAIAAAIECENGGRDGGGGGGVRLMEPSVDTRCVPARIDAYQYALSDKAKVSLDRKRVSPKKCLP